MTAGSADLHVHTTHSDGSCSPGEVVRAAANVGLAALAITDHDTISALPVARPEAERLGIELVGGVELTTEFEGRELHILGLFVADDHPELVATCERLRLGRQVRIEEMTKRLVDLGLSIDLEAIRRVHPRATIGRRHLAEWLSRTGQVAGERDAFARFLGDDGAVQVAKPRLGVAEAIALIGRADGVAGLAHPPYDLRPSALEVLASMGMKAIETAGRGVSKARNRRLVDQADRLGLLPMAGSDFHAPGRPGRWVGAITTPKEDLARLREAAVRHTPESKEEIPR